jgi:hypothetical protein
MAPRPKHTSRSRRRSRRSAQRESVVAAIKTGAAVIPEDLDDRIQAVLAAATGSTSLPLSDQGDSWDAGAAAKGLTDAQLKNAYFWVDPDGDATSKASYKLGFAENRSGTLTAVWRGVTAAAGAVQGARGGVQIPSGDVAGVKAKIGAYYTKAAKQYDDDNIKPPWAASAGQSAAFLLAYAEVAVSEGDVYDRLYASGENGEEILVGVGGGGPAIDEFLARRAYWEEQLGGKPSEGTDKDKRLKANRPAASVEREQLEAARAALAPAPAEESIDEFFARALSDDVVFEEVSHDVASAIVERLTARLENFEVEAPVTEKLPAPNGAQPVVTPAPDGGVSGELRWVANLVPEATLTDDGRAMAPGSLTWRELPLTLMAMVETSEGGHVGAEVAGRIDEIYRDGNMVKGSGVFAQTEYGSLIASLAVGDPVDEEVLARVQSVLLVDSEGALVASLVGDQTLRGISVDLAIHQYEVGPQSDYFDEDGNWLTERPARDEGEEAPSLLDLLFGDETEEPIFVVTEAVIGAVTVCPFQAFADATIALAASGAPAVWTVTQQAGWVVNLAPKVGEPFPAGDGIEVPADGTEATLTASAAGLAPEAPPSAWFDDPELTELTPLTVDEEGRIFGHAAAWDTCHLGIPDVCTTAPSTETNYAYFLLKEVLCADGERVPCGTITLETGHADRSLGRGDATAHYDNTGLAVADVNVGEDEFGIWVAGALRSDVDAEKARELRGAVLSGDWRSVNGNLELVALLAVNVPGFPVPRARALVASSDEGAEVLALVAAGITVGRAPDRGGVLSPIQQEKIRVFEAIASGRVAALRVRAAGVLSADEAREAAAFTTYEEEPEPPAEEPEEPAPLAPPPPPGADDEPVDDDPDQAEGPDA